jgi:hypothetical protein
VTPKNIWRQPMEEEQRYGSSGEGEPKALGGAHVKDRRNTNSFGNKRKNPTGRGRVSLRGA